MQIFRRWWRLLLLTITRLCISVALLVVSLSAQSPRRSQETIDALQDREIAGLKITVNDNRLAIERLTAELIAMRTSMDRFTGIGIGFGAALTALQALQLIMSTRKKPS